MSTTINTTDSSWAQQEFGPARLVDERLVKRLVKIADDFYKQPQASIPQASGDAGQAKATYRFFDNDDIKIDDLLAPHRQRTGERCADHQTVLMLNDTSYLEFTGHPATQGLGALSQKETLGMLIHPTLAATLEGTPLGLADLQIWTRPQEDFGKSHRLKERAVAEKESQKWLNSYRATVGFQNNHPALHLVFISDRESDIFDLFDLAQAAPLEARLEPTAKRPDLLIRVAQNRCLVPTDPESSEDHIAKHLWEFLANQPLAGIYAIDVPRRDKQPARHAELEIRFAEVMIALPKGQPKRGRQPVKLWAIWAHEKNPAAGVEPISWMLLTTIPVTTLADAIEKIQWYTRRWLIELLFKVLKSGCRFEDRQLETADRLQRCLVIDLVVAWRILYMTTIGRELPNLPCTTLFEDDEWQALYGFVNQTTVLPQGVPSLQAAIRMVAKLGGFLGRKSDGEPGSKTLWLGLHRLNDITTAWRLFNPQRKKSKKTRKSCG